MASNHRDRTHLPLNRSLGVGLALSLLLGGCAPAVQRAVQQDAQQGETASVTYPAPAGEAKTYEALADALPAAGAHPLTGRTLVVDPGHGGKETGAVGPSGLMEKDVNLAVARELAELLRGAGATVILTREGDSGVAPAGSTLSDDLKARIAKANQAHADLFVSVHHNATLDPKNELIRTETYYKMDDSGPSVDAAMAIHRHLLRNLRMPQERMMPGNYAVLRAAMVPAVLGEASYITNAFTEKKLRNPEKQRLEAQAYYAGILDYFAKGTPRVVTLQQLVNKPAQPRIEAHLDGGGGTVDPASIDLELDGARCQAFFDPEGLMLSYESPVAVGNGDHVFSLQFRNMSGNASERSELKLKVALPPATINTHQPLAALPLDGPAPLGAQVLDYMGRPVADGTEVQWFSLDGRFENARTQTRGGWAYNYLSDVRKAHPEVRVRAGQVTMPLQLAATHARALLGRVEGPDEKPIEGATIAAIGKTETRVVQSNADGYWWFEQPPKDLTTLRMLKPGYRVESIPMQQPEYVPMQLQDLTAASMQGQTVFLNPEGGSEDRDPLRRQMAGYNWLVADSLRGYLEAAGARVVLTRNRDESPSDVERIRMANTQGATLFLTIGHASTDGVRTSHYPSSAKGKAIATAVREALVKTLGARSEGTTFPDSTYTLIQTTCPSVTVVPGTDTGNEDAAARARREAYGIFLGLQPQDPKAGFISLKVVGSDGKPVVNVATSLDMQWSGQTDAQGDWRWGNLVAGEHHVVVTDGKRTRTFWVIGLQPGENRVVTVDLERPDVPENLARH